MLEHMGIEERKWYQGSDKVAGHHRKGKKHQVLGKLDLEQGKVHLESYDGLPVQHVRSGAGALCRERSDSGDTSYRGWTGSSSREAAGEQQHQPSRSAGCNTRPGPKCMTPSVSLLE